MKRHVTQLSLRSRDQRGWSVFRSQPRSKHRSGSLNEMCRLMGRKQTRKSVWVKASDVSATCRNRECLPVRRQLLIKELFPPSRLSTGPVVWTGSSPVTNHYLQVEKKRSSSSSSLVSMSDAPLTARAPGKSTSDNPLHDPKHLLLIWVSFIPKKKNKKILHMTTKWKTQMAWINQVVCYFPALVSTCAGTCWAVKNLS